MLFLDGLPTEKNINYPTFYLYRLALGGTIDQRVSEFVRSDPGIRKRLDEREERSTLLSLRSLYPFSTRNGEWLAREYRQDLAREATYALRYSNSA